MPTQEQINNLTASLEAGNYLDKKQLKELLEIGSINTVKATLRACGLDAQKESYSPEEIWNNFIPARQMIEEGKKLKDVAAHFGVGEAEELENSDSVDEMPASEIDGGFVVASSTFAKDQIALGAAATTASMVQEGAAKGVKEVAKYIPDMISQTILEEMQEGGAINQAFQEFNRQVRSNGGDGSQNIDAYMGQVLGEKRKKLKHQLSPQNPSLLAQLPPSEENSNSSSES
jgi:hypothetical protein